MSCWWWRLEVAARFGDPNPVLVGTATRNSVDLTHVTGSTGLRRHAIVHLCDGGQLPLEPFTEASTDRQITEQDISYRFLTCRDRRQNRKARRSRSIQAAWWTSRLSAK